MKLRVIHMNAYDGCIPVTVYMVQKYVGGCIFGKWVNIKGFQYKEKGRGIDIAVETLKTKHKTKENNEHRRKQTNVGSFLYCSRPESRER